MERFSPAALSHLPPSPTPCIWASVGEEPTDGKVEKDEERGGGGAVQGAGSP